MGDGYREFLHAKWTIDHHAHPESLARPQALREYGLAGDGVANSRSLLRLRKNRYAVDRHCRRGHCCNSRGRVPAQPAILDWPMVRERGIRSRDSTRLIHDY